MAYTDKLRVVYGDIEGMKQAQGITEQLKAENALEWTGCPFLDRC